jgi:hypothetical protein
MKRRYREKVHGKYTKNEQLVTRLLENPVEATTIVHNFVLLLVEDVV